MLAKGPKQPCRATWAPVAKASAAVFLNIPDMRREMVPWLSLHGELCCPCGSWRALKADFLDEIWDEPYPVRQAKRISWGSSIARLEVKFLLHFVETKLRPWCRRCVRGSNKLLSHSEV